MRVRRPEDRLEEFLDERTIPDDPHLAALARIAHRLEKGFDVDPADPYRERAMFIQGVTARKPRFPWGRVLWPVALIAVVVAFAAVSRTARPADILYPVRNALDNIGLAEGPGRAAAGLLDEAERHVEEAEASFEEEEYDEARQSANEVVELIVETRAFLEDAGPAAQERGAERAAELEQRALDVLFAVNQQQEEEQQEEEEEEEGDEAG